MLHYLGRKTLEKVHSLQSNINSVTKILVNSRNEWKKKKEGYEKEGLKRQVGVYEWCRKEYANTIVQTQQDLQKWEESINYCKLIKFVKERNFDYRMTLVKKVAHEYEDMRLNFTQSYLDQLIPQTNSICGESDKKKTIFIQKKVNSQIIIFAKGGRINQEYLRHNKNQNNFCTLSTPHPHRQQKARAVAAQNSELLHPDNSTLKKSHQPISNSISNTNQQSQQQSKENQSNIQNIKSTIHLQPSNPLSLLQYIQNNNTHPQIISQNISHISSQQYLKMSQNDNDSIEIISITEGNNFSYSYVQREKQNIEERQQQQQQQQHKQKEQLYPAQEVFSSQAYEQVQKIDEQQIIESIQKSQVASLNNNNNNNQILDEQNKKVKEVEEEENDDLNSKQSISSSISQITIETKRSSLTSSSDNNISSSSPQKDESSLLTSTDSSNQKGFQAKNKKFCNLYQAVSERVISENDSNNQSFKQYNSDVNFNKFQRHKGRSMTYKIEKKIGDGCSSIVYLAKELDELTNTPSDTLIAVKKFKKRKETHFESEQKILQIISGEHPNIVNVQNINVPQMEIQSEYYPNGDLLEFVIKRGALPESQARYFFKGICDAVLFIKQSDICHRDLKLENILLDSQFNPIVIDFAFANFNKTNFTECIGTDGYQAPELLQKQPYCGHATDSFSLGVILFEMLMGKPPFQSAKLDQGLYYKFVSDNEEYWNAFKKYNDPSDEAKNLINNLLESNPSKRFTIEQVFSHQWMHKSQPEVQTVQ